MHVQMHVGQEVTLATFQVFLTYLASQHLLFLTLPGLAVATIGCFWKVGCRVHVNYKELNRI